jgi:hypothetical protein
MTVVNSTPKRPTTPPPPVRTNRLSAQFLQTPEQPGLNVPFSPGLKRSNSDGSPDNKNTLFTPKVADDDDKLKKLKTPQFFLSAKHLQFNDEESENLVEISNKLKNNLSSALNKLPEKSNATTSLSNKFVFTELSFEQSPTKKSRSSSHSSWSPSKSLQRANLNLQTLQQSPKPPNTSMPPARSLANPFEDRKVSIPMSQSVPTNLACNLSHLEPLQTSHNQRVNIPSPDDDNSAQDALLAAISRQKMRARRNSFSHKASVGENKSLPRLNVALDNEKNNEQDAVLSLMSLSSPQAVKFSHSRTQSYDSATKATLPPISSIMNPGQKSNSDAKSDNKDDEDDDDEATDIDVDNSTDEE